MQLVGTLTPQSPLITKTTGMEAGKERTEGSNWPPTNRHDNAVELPSYDDPGKILK